jgi:urease accessory protein
MLRSTDVVRNWSGAATDEAVLAYDERNRRRIVLLTERGREFLLDLPEVPSLRDGDAIRLDTGELVLVRAAEEPLMEIRCRDVLQLARLAWHIGNRHVAAEIRADAIRIRADKVMAEMAMGLGAEICTLEAAFNPEAGAYSGGTVSLARGGGGGPHHG